MRKAIVMTVYDRMDYIQEVLDSWLKVRELENWSFYVSFNPSDNTETLRSAISAKFHKSGVSFIEMHQATTLSILEHHYQVFEQLFGLGNDFVIRVDDDLVVSDDILEYFDFAISEYTDDKTKLSIHAYSEKEGGSLGACVPLVEFSPWIYGFWKDRWSFLRENWDSDYSTYEGSPGNMSGYDWNFNLRVYPAGGYYGIYPEVCRVKNIGAWGTHGTPELLPPAVGFKMHNEKVFNV